MILHIKGGEIKTIYNERLDLRGLGPINITRASHVEPTPDGRWVADMSPIGGPKLPACDKRSEALAAEMAWLEEHL